MNLKTTGIFLIVLSLFTTCTTEKKERVSQNQNTITIDSAQKNLTKEESADFDNVQFLAKSRKEIKDSLEMAKLYSKGLLHFSKNQMDSFYFYNLLLKKKAKKNKSLKFIGKAQFNLGYFNDEVVHRSDSAFFYYQQAKNTYLKTGDKQSIHKSLFNIALLQKNKNDFFGAKETLTEALNYLNTDTHLAAIYNELGTNNRKLQNYSEASKYYRLALNHTNSSKKTVKYKNNLATLLTEIEDHDKALPIFQEILADTILKKQSVTYARILDNYTYAQWKDGKMELETPFYEALLIRKQKNDKRGQIASYTHLGEYSSKTDPELAKKYLDSVIQLSRLIKTPKAETDALQFLMDLAPTNLSFRNRYIFLKDSMYANELKVKTQFAKMKYDDEQEKAQILELETETVQKRAELAEQKIQKVIFLFLSGLLLISGTLLYYALRQRHKKEKLQEVYNTEKRISQDLHDGLANDVFGLMTSLQNKKKDAMPLLNRLEDIYQTTRRISHENAAIGVGENFTDELNILIGNYQDKNTNILVKGMRSIDWTQLEEHKCVIVHRTLKELLVNMKKHAQASLVSLQFKSQKNQLHISYSDNGIGFQQKDTNGIGLINTGNRINSVGGRIIFESKQGSGAKINFSIPI